VGPDVQLMTDANDGYSEREAPEHLRQLADLGVTVAEDPCSLRPNRAFERLQGESPIPILVDRACSSFENAALFLERGAKELSLKTNGTGIANARRIADLAHANQCAAHVGNVTESSLGALMAFEIQSALPTRHYSLPAETTGFLWFAEEYVTEALRA